MSKKKRVVISDSGEKKAKRPKPTSSKFAKREEKTGSDDVLIFRRENYIYMLAGAGLILLSLILMSGGGMPSPEVWDEDIIYSFRRITLAPILFVAGLVLEVIGIFK